MTLRAVVFVKRNLAFGAGHVGWAFEYRSGLFNVGSVENISGLPHSTPEAMDFWTVDTLDPLAEMRERAYDAFKVITTPQAHPRAAWQTVVWLSQQPYLVLGRNCLDDVYDVIRAFGQSELPLPAHHLLPNRWFDALPCATQLLTADATIPLQGLGRVRRYLPLARRVRRITTHDKGMAPVWRVPETPPWQSFTDTLRQLLPVEVTPQNVTPPDAAQPKE